MIPFPTMFVSKRKKREKAAKKLQLFLDALEIWDKFQSVHIKIYSVKTSLTPLFNTNEEIRIHYMPELLYKYCKLNGINAMIKILKPQLKIMEEEIQTQSFIQQSIRTLEGLFGLEKKNFELPNMDCSKGYIARCTQFESMLESFEVHIKMLKMKLEQSEIIENSNCKEDITPKDDQSVAGNANTTTPKDNQSVVDDVNPKDEIEDYKKKQIFGAHNETEKVLIWRLYAIYHKLSEIENGLYIIEHDKMPSNKCKEDFRIKLDLEPFVKYGC